MPFQLVKKVEKKKPVSLEGENGWSISLFGTLISPVNMKWSPEVQISRLSLLGLVMKNSAKGSGIDGLVPSAVFIEGTLVRHRVIRALP